MIKNMLPDTQRNDLYLFILISLPSFSLCVDSSTWTHTKFNTECHFPETSSLPSFLQVSVASLTLTILLPSLPDSYTRSLKSHPGESKDSTTTKSYQLPLWVDIRSPPSGISWLGFPLGTTFAPFSAQVVRMGLIHLPTPHPGSTWKLFSDFPGFVPLFGITKFLESERF